MKKSFILYHDLCDVLDDLTDEQAGQLFKEIHNYSKSKTHDNPQKPTGLNGLLKAVFNPFKSHIDRDFELWQQKSQINQKNGKKGGRPKTKKTHWNPEKGVNVNVNVNDKVNVKDKDYKFKGKVIKLSQQHYDSWKLQFQQLNLDRELKRLDEYYQKKGITNWFFPCHGALKKANQNIAPKSNWEEMKNLTEEEKYGYSLDD